MASRYRGSRRSRFSKDTMWAGFYNAPGYGLFDLVQTTLQVHKAGQ